MDEQYEYSSVIFIQIALQISQAELYPNPAHSEFMILRDEEASKTCSIEVYSTMGQLIFSKRNISDLAISIDTRDWENGMYTLRLVSPDRIDTYQLIIDHELR